MPHTSRLSVANPGRGEHLAEESRRQPHPNRYLFDDGSSCFTKFMQSSPDGILVVDEYGTIALANPRLCRMLDYAEEELLGQALGMLFPADACRHSSCCRQNQGAAPFLPPSCDAHACLPQAPCFRDRYEASESIQIPQWRASRKSGLSWQVSVNISLIPADSHRRFFCIVLRDLNENTEAQTQLREAITFSESIIAAIPDILFEVDRQLVYRNIWTSNPQLLAAPKESLLGRSARDVLDPETMALALEGIREADEKGVCHGKVLGIRLPDGSRRWFKHSFAKRKAHRPENDTFVVVSRDVTERKELTQEIEQRRQEFFSLAEHIPDNVARWDTQGRYLYVNPVHERTLGKPSRELIGTFIPETHTEVREAIRQAIATGRQVMVQIKLPDSDTIHEVHVMPEKDARGKIVSVLGVGRDISERYYKEKLLTEDLQSFVSLADSLPLPVYRYDRAGRRLYVNRFVKEHSVSPPADLIGTAPNEVPSLKTDHASTLRIMNGIQRAFATGMKQEIEGLDGTAANGTRFWVRMVAIPEKDRFGEVRTVLGVGIDESDKHQLQVALKKQHRLQAKLERREQEFRTLIENSPDAVARFDLDSRYLYANPTLSRQVGIPAAALLDRKPSELDDNPRNAFLETKLNEVIESGQPATFEFHGFSGNIDLHSLITLTPEFDSHGRICSVLSVGRDITEIVATRQQIHQMAFFDSLTGLPNRALFNDRLGRMLSDAAWHGQTAALMMLDIDRFKAVNDTLGHAVGDLLLTEVTSRVMGCIRDYDTVARIGGDEFGILLPEIRKSTDLGVIANKIQAAFTAPFRLAEKEFYISCCIGIAVYPDDATTPEDLLRYADAAMHHAKHSGRNASRFYSRDLTLRAQERLHIESELRRAVERDQLELHYQPKVDLETGAIIGSEALIRWRHPELGLIRPDQFIPIAEDTGLIVEIGKWVLQNACRTAAEWNATGQGLHKLAINLSARQFKSGDLYPAVCAALEESGCQAGWIELEITESLLIDEGGETLPLLQQFRALGISIAIDDFGTGYSALSYLARFPIDTLKIDRSFIQTITTDSYRAELVRAILSIARCLGQQVVAEGVETHAQADFLVKEGCRVAQGFLFSKPVIKAEFPKIPHCYEKPANDDGKDSGGLEQRA